MIRKHHLHQLMEVRFGDSANAASHSWLRRVTGKCHVADCSEKEVERAIRKLTYQLRHSRRVRKSTWNRL